MGTALGLGETLNRVLRAGMAFSVLAGLTFTAACGEKKGPEQAAGRPAAASAAEAARGTGLTQPQLERAAVSEEDLPGYTVDWMGASVSAPSLPAEPAECQAMGDTTGMVSQYRPTARLSRLVDKPVEAASGLTLAAYRAGDAEKAMADVREGIRTCAGRTFDPGDTFQYKAVTALPDPGKGDDSLSFKLLQVVGGSKKGLEVAHMYVMVRTGSTVAIFRALSRDSHVPVVPANVVDAQVRKLAKAG